MSDTDLVTIVPRLAFRLIPTLHLATFSPMPSPTTPLEATRIFYTQGTATAEVWNIALPTPTVTEVPP